MNRWFLALAVVAALVAAEPRRAAADPKCGGSHDLVISAKVDGALLSITEDVDASKDGQFVAHTRIDRALPPDACRHSSVDLQVTAASAAVAQLGGTLAAAAVLTGLGGDPNTKGAVTPASVSALFKRAGIAAQVEFLPIGPGVLAPTRLDRLHALILAGLSLDGSNTVYAQTLAALGQLISSTIGPACIPALLADLNHPDCVVQDVTMNQDGTTSVYQIPQCIGLSDPTSPCWRLEVKPQCTNLSPQGVGITVDRHNMSAPANTNARVECNTIQSPH